jgi:hypothetical protein
MAGTLNWANCRVVKDGATYQMLVENSTVSQSFTRYATASNLLGPWTVQNGGEILYTAGVTGLQVPDGSISPGQFYKVGNVWHWFPWLSSDSLGDNKTRIFHTTSTDLIIWTPPKMVRGIEPSDLLGGQPLSQFADVNILEVGGETYLWSTMVSNAGSSPCLMRFAGGFDQLVYQNPGGEYPITIANPSVNQTLSVGSHTTLNFGSVVKSTHGAWDGTTFTVLDNCVGEYEVQVSALALTGGTGTELHLFLKVNGTVTAYLTLRNGITPASTFTLEGSATLSCILGDQITVCAFQGSGTAWEVLGGISHYGRLTINRKNQNQFN